MEGESNGGGANYSRPRIVIAFLLAILLGFLLVVDASSVDYAVGEVLVTILLGAILTLVGLELTDFLHGGKP